MDWTKQPCTHICGLPSLIITAATARSITIPICSAYSLVWDYMPAISRTQTRSSRAMMTYYRQPGWLTRQLWRPVSALISVPKRSGMPVWISCAATSHNLRRSHSNRFDREGEQVYKKRGRIYLPRPGKLVDGWPDLYQAIRFCNVNGVPFKRVSETAPEANGVPLN